MQESQFVVVHRTHHASNEQLLADVKRVALQLNSTSVSTGEYERLGRYSVMVFRNRFGGWTRALKKIGLSPRKHQNITRRQMIADLRAVARRLNTKVLSCLGYAEHAKYSVSTALHLFGTWAAAVDAAGLKCERRAPRDANELLENLRELWKQLGRQPLKKDLWLPISRFKPASYCSHFGSFAKALVAFDCYVNGKTVVPLRTGRPRRWHKTARNVNWRLRYLILSRDGFRCRACGKSPANDPAVKLEVDHILPWSRGGETVAENLQTLCVMCNSGKSNV